MEGRSSGPLSCSATAPEEMHMSEKVLRDTAYAEELVEPAVYRFNDESEGRIEHLRFKVGDAAGKEGYRLSWWRDGRMLPRPLDLAEDEFIALLQTAVKTGVFSHRTVNRLREILAQ
jgi:hypothetical protein